MYWVTSGSKCIGSNNIIRNLSFHPRNLSLPSEAGSPLCDSKPNSPYLTSYQLRKPNKKKQKPPEGSAWSDTGQLSHS